MTTPTWISWKMNKLLAEAKAFASRLQECPPPSAVQRFVLPALPEINTVAVALVPDTDPKTGRTARRTRSCWGELNADRPGISKRRP
jgi:hypothetical protein